MITTMKIGSRGVVTKVENQAAQGKCSWQRRSDDSINRSLLLGDGLIVNSRGCPAKKSRLHRRNWHPINLMIRNIPVIKRNLAEMIQK